MSLKNPVEMLVQWAKEQPNRGWLYQPVDGVWKKYTFAECEAQVRGMATALRKLGLPPGSSVAISGRNTAHWVLADLAIAMAGYVSVGLYPKQSRDAVKFILEHSETKAIFIGPMPDADDFMSAVPEGVIKIGFPFPDVKGCEHQWDDLVRASEPFAGYQAPPTDEIYTLIYTSGTTGNPKGVIITIGNMLFAAEGMMKAMPGVGTERFFSYLPLAHAFERGAVELGSIYYGAEVFFLESIEKLAQQLPEIAPTRFFGVPLVYGRFQAGILQKLPQKKLDRLLKIPLVSSLIKKKIKTGLGLQNARYIFAGAAPMPVPLMLWLDKIGITVLQGYGMTENNIYATANLPGANRWGSAGRAQPGADMRIGEDGEIQFKHPAVTRGYYKDAEKTAELFTADGWLRTGDKGRIDEDGYLYITGRTKDIFKTQKGKYVAPAPIEGALSRCTDIDQLCFVGSNLKQPIMMITLSEDALKKPHAEVEANLLAEMNAVNAELEDHERIAKIIVCKEPWTIDNHLMTPTMKVKRNEVEKRYTAIIDAHAPNVKEKIVWE
ncbi:AMP-binding protein [Solimonas marina]|uniref:AMP-binding protein n=1 Tax=Solimonas marina TaxID=2714601 RepID=A0A970B7F4_9GAMM|nr:AMP-binding protein [Solimonas marina]NKF23843.1 AMP-binding protein [Solimonas marina]